MECQVIGFDCPEEDLCKRCGGSGNEPPTRDGSNPCKNCDHCFDVVIGWSTGIEPDTKSVDNARDFFEFGIV